MKLKLFRFRYINILKEIIENNFPFSPEFGRPCIIIMKLKLFRFRYINILKEIIENNVPFSPEFGRPFFVLGVSQDALLAKSLSPSIQIFLIIATTYTSTDRS